MDWDVAGARVLLIMLGAFERRMTAFGERSDGALTCGFKREDDRPVNEEGRGICRENVPRLVFGREDRMRDVDSDILRDECDGPLDRGPTAILTPVKCNERTAKATTLKDPRHLP
jgi:hypothetical protein